MHETRVPLIVSNAEILYVHRRRKIVGHHNTTVISHVVYTVQHEDRHGASVFGCFEWKYFLQSYVYWTVHHLYSCVKRKNQLDATCFII